MELLAGLNGRCLLVLGLLLLLLLLVTVAESGSSLGLLLVLTHWLLHWLRMLLVEHGVMVLAERGWSLHLHGLLMQMVLGVQGCRLVGVVRAQGWHLLSLGVHADGCGVVHRVVVVLGLLPVVRDRSVVQEGGGGHVGRGRSKRGRH